MGCDILMENILKGIVVSHAKNGVRLHQIKEEFMRHAGDFWPNMSAKRLNDCLCGIHGLFYRHDEYQGHVTWYAGKPSADEKDANVGMPKASDQMARRRASNACRTRNNENVRSHGPPDQNNNNCSASTKNTSNGRLSTKSNNTSFRTSVNSDQMRENARGPNRFVHSQKTTYHNSKRKTTASFYDHELVGDDFLLSLATIELNCPQTKRGSVKQCGLCVSGQTIQSAAKRLRNCGNIKIILNVGSVDLLHGRDFVDMRDEFKRLMQICQERNIQVTITTLAPLANALNAEGLREKFDRFNKFLIQTYSHSHKVIEIHKCMIDPQSGKILFDCYRGGAEYVSGSNRPHTLWNRIGRQRILKFIKSRIGF